MLWSDVTSILNAMPHAAAIADRTGYLVAMNTAWVALGQQGDAGEAWWAGQLEEAILGRETPRTTALRDGPHGLPHWEDRWLMPIVVEGATDHVLLSIQVHEANWIRTSRLAGEPSGLLETISFGVVELDAQGIFKWVNPGYCRLTGYSESELIGRISPLELTHPRDRLAALQRFKRLLSQEVATHQVEKRIVKRDGSFIWIRGTVNARIDCGGKLESILGVIEDITDKRQAEEALRESEQRYRGFFNSAGVGTVQLGLDWKFGAVNEKFCHIVGYERDELVGVMSPLDLIPVGDRQAEIENFERFFSGSEPHYCRESRLVHRDGRIVHVRVSSELIRDSAGAPLCTAAVVEDITEMKQAQHEVLQVRDRLKLALDVSQLGVWDWYIESNDVYWNDSHYCIFGYAPYEFKPTVEHYVAILDPEDMARVLDEMEKSKTVGHEFKITYRLRLEDGRRRWVEGQGITIRDAEGVVRSIGVVRDITTERSEREARELMLQELNHRTKNMISVVKSMAVLGSGQSSNAIEREDFLERLAGLANSHDLLVKTEWRGIGLRDLVRAQTGHLTSAPGERFQVTGLDLMLRSNAAQILGLALHELATNAAKYGSLRFSTGTVHVTWSIRDADEAMFCIVWTEAGGARPERVQRSGFGMSIILDACEHSLDANVVFTARDDGIEWRMECPLQKLQATSVSQG